MNANEIINDEMDTKMELTNKLNDIDLTLDEKLAAIDTAMQTAQVKHQKANPEAAPLDPADLTKCEGCQ